MPELWVEQPPDLYSQVLALGYTFTRRLDYEDQEDFKQELLLEIFSRWGEYDPSRAKMSVWVTLRAKGLYRTYSRIVNRRKYRQTNFDFQSDDSEFQTNENWLFYRSPDLYIEEDGSLNVDEGVQFVRQMVQFSDEELLVMDMKLDNRTLAEIALAIHGVPEREVDELAAQLPRRSSTRYPVPMNFQVPDEQLERARRVISRVRKKLQSAQSMINSVKKTHEPVETMVRLHAERALPFNNLPFTVSTPSHGVKNLTGIQGVQTAIALNHGAAVLQERMGFEINIPTERQRIACEFWEKYGQLISKCASIAVDDVAAPKKLVGVLPKTEAVADVLMGLTITESILKTERIRESAPFLPTQNDFALLVWNLQNQGLLNGPAFDGAIDSWRGRLTHGRKSGGARISKYAAV